MRMPKRPPSLDSLMDSLAESERAKRIIQTSRDSASQRSYLHWDKLKFHTPPNGLSHEEWWLTLKLNRYASKRWLPDKDTSQKPFWFSLPDQVREDTHHVDQDASGRIQGEADATASSSMQERYIISSLMEEAITSSQIEGAVTTRRIAKQMLRSNRRPKDTGEQMILNNYAAMQLIREISHQPLTEEIIFDLHRELTDKTLEDPTAAGRLRRSDEPVCVVDTRDNEVLHTPPSADELPARMSALCAFANRETPDYFIHPVIRAIILHFWMAYDHPFTDGNGRCARALFYWSMLREGYWLCESISISSVIKKAHAQYERAFLYTETDENDLTYFILYHLRVVRKAIKELHKYIAVKTQGIRQVEKVMRSSDRFNYRQLGLLSHALRHSDAEYTVHSHQTSHSVTQQTARSDLYALAKRGLLHQRKVGKTFYFTPASELERKLGETQ